MTIGAGWNLLAFLFAALCGVPRVAAGAVIVRDTKSRDGGALSVPASAWRAFIAATK